MKKQWKSLKPRFSRFMMILTGLTVSAYVFYINTLYAWAADPPAAGDDAVARWNAVIGFLVPWIGRLGGVVMLLGGIMFGLGFKNDDADGKTRGLQTLVAGAIVIAVGSGYTTFVGT